LDSPPVQTESGHDDSRRVKLHMDSVLLKHWHTM